MISKKNQLDDIILNDVEPDVNVHFITKAQMIINELIDGALYPTSSDNNLDIEIGKAKGSLESAYDSFSQSEVIDEEYDYCLSIIELAERLSDTRKEVEKKSLEIDHLKETNTVYRKTLEHWR